MSAGSSSVPSFGEAEAKSTGVQPTIEPLDPPHKRSSDSKKQSDDEKAQNGSHDGVGEKGLFEDAVEVDADLEVEDDPEISQIPPEVRRVVSLHDDSRYSLSLLMLRAVDSL
ncbi:hypothetical protein O1611_g10519 [Lasiodiplodia mahajangana]|uniref:Uncharacterized protein n=1 Tax=Lasiodiplodia mahajangana TaxID=1108764 RepID=A0ACC2IXL2_9PEZI|nr:hypothetical protein O1611_g10519 [Lasiodiplodia mahajangana]